jgi:hypothetical protein
MSSLHGVDRPHGLGSGQHVGNNALAIERERTRAITGEQPEPALVDAGKRR